MNSLQPPFSDIVGESSPFQKAIKMIWEIFANHPVPNNKSIASQSAAEQIVLHLLGTMNSIGMINAAGYHSAAVTLMRSIEDALDCLFAVVQSDVNANKWLNGELKASQAARTWTADKVVDQSIPLGDYRKNIRHGLNKYSHCSPNQTSWNIYRKSDEEGTYRLELNYQHAVISKNGYYIDRYLCIHLSCLKGQQTAQLPGIWLEAELFRFRCKKQSMAFYGRRLQRLHHAGQERQSEGRFAHRE